MLVSHDTKGSLGRSHLRHDSALHRTRRLGLLANPRLAASAFLLASVFVFVHPPGAASASRERQPGPSRLWHAFPLAPVPKQHGATAGSKTRPVFQQPHTTVATQLESGNSWTDIAVIVGLSGVAVAVALVFLAARRFGGVRIRLASFMPKTKKGAPLVSSFIRRRSDEQSETKAAEAAGEVPGRALGDAVTSYTLHQPGDSAAPLDESPASESSGHASVPEPVSYDELGQKIANVLRAAEENSAQLLAEARSQAQAIRDAAELEAREARAQLDAETAERRAESERIRADANRYAEERRRTADVEAHQTRTEAEAEARSLREAGEGMRRRLEEKGIARRQELLEASGSIEKQLREALTTCRDVSSEIERLLGESSVELDEELLTEVKELESPESEADVSEFLQVEPS
jgi:hypothetical protein